MTQVRDGRWRWGLGAAALLLGSGCWASAGAVSAEAALPDRMTELVLQLGVILLAARIAGVACRRWLHLPDVLGEVGAGILIGPYLLGPHLGLFHTPAAGVALPVSPELYGLATVASILLLYLAGLETDLAMFLRYSAVGSAVGVGGVLISFLFGNAVAVWTGLAASYASPPALFLGAISTATSVGISARVLSQRQRMDSPEGVTILAGAVVDDVLGIVLLAIVVGMCRHSRGAGDIDWKAIGLIGMKAVSFWLVCTGIGLLAARRVSKVLEWFGSSQTMATLSLGLALLLAGCAERANLAMIIGAYIMGLSLSRVDAAHALRDRLEPVCDTLVAVFFTVMGMLVNLERVWAVLGVGLIYALAGMAAKVAGCGLPALMTRFRLKGALRIGVGMLPRGEVTLLMAGTGLAGGFISQDVFGVAVLMTLLSTLVAPLAMVRLFDDAPGLKQKDSLRTVPAAQPIRLALPNSAVADFLLSRIIKLFESEACYCHQLVRGEHIYQVRKDDMSLAVTCQNDTLEIQCDERERPFARLILLEALASLVAVFEGLREIQTKDLRRSIG